MDLTSGVAGILWWIGIGVMFLVVIPSLIFAAHRLFAMVRAVAEYLEDMEPYGPALVANVESLSALEETRETVGTLRKRLTDYAADVDRRL